MADTAQEKADRAYAWGVLSALGLAVAAVTAVIDQAVKLWLVDVFDLGSREQVALTPFVNLVLTWNTGISYGLFPQESAFGQWALLAFKAVVVAFLWVWLARTQSRLGAVALGLIIGGAVGNAIDRLHWPGVMISCSSTLKPAASASAGMYSTSPMSPLLRVSLACCTIRVGPGVPQKRPDRGENNRSNRSARGEIPGQAPYRHRGARVCRKATEANATSAAPLDCVRSCCAPY